MWSRIKRMSCIPSKAPNHQALNGDRSEATTDIDLPSRCRQVVIPDLSGIEKTVAMRIAEKEAARTEEVQLKRSSADSSPETSSLKQMHAPMIPKGLKPDTSGTNPDTFSHTNLGVDRLPLIFEDATTLTASDRAALKLTGTAAPGSHSALFGLTPDGHREDEADYSSPKLPRAKMIAGNTNTSAPNVDGPEDAKMKISNYQRTVSHSALFGLVPVGVAKPEESEAKQASSKTERGQKVRSEGSERAGADKGTSRRPQTISHSALFGLMPEGFGEKQANKWLSNAEPVRGAEAVKVSSGGLGNAGPVALSPGCIGWGCHDGHER